MNFDLLATLLLAHMIGDFALQSNTIVRWKESTRFGLFVHVFIHFIVLILLIERGPNKWWLIGPFVTIHYIIDWCKLSYPHEKETAAFVLDQVVHFVTIFLVTAYFGGRIMPALDSSVLYPGAIYSTILPATMLMWIIGIDAADTQRDTPFFITLRKRMFLVSKLAGLPLLAFVLFNVVIVLLLDSQSTVFSIISLPLN